MKIKGLHMQVERNQEVIIIWHYMYGICKTFINQKFKAAVCMSGREGF